MSTSPQALVREELVLAIAALLPSTMPFYNAQKAQRINWRVLIEIAEKGKAGGLTPPWTVIWSGGSQSTDQYGLANDTFIQRYTLWWVESLRNPDGSARTTFEVRAAIEDGLSDVRTSLRGVQFTNFTLLDVGAITVSEETEVNKFFIGSNLPFEAGQCDFELVWGTSP